MLVQLWYLVILHCSYGLLGCSILWFLHHSALSYCKGYSIQPSHLAAQLIWFHCKVCCLLQGCFTTVSHPCVLLHEGCSSGENALFLSKGLYSSLTVQSQKTSQLHNCILPYRSLSFVSKCNSCEIQTISNKLLDPPRHVTFWNSLL